MKKVLIIIPYNNGTIGKVSLNLFNAFSKNCEITAKAILVHKFHQGYAEYDKIEFCSLNSYKGINKIYGLIRQILWLKRIKKNFKPDVTVSTLFGCSTLSVLSGGNDRKIGIFHSPHHQAKSNGIFNYWIVAFSFKFIYCHLDSLFCVSHEIYDSISNLFPKIRKEQLDVVYNIHDIENIRNLATEKLSADEDRVFNGKVILYCGRLDQNKAPERLLKAFARVHNQLANDIRIVMLGSDSNDLWNDLEALSHQLGIKNNIYYWGVKTNPYKYMVRAKVVVSTSFSEGLPGVLIESLLLGTPIVATNSSKGIWEILSCVDSYNANLDNIYITCNGVISSNLSDRDATKNDLDISNITNGIEYVLNNDLTKNSFKFEKNVDADIILNKFVQN
jgi:glycosyltransferase involved in cell wall biosynthesis